MASLVALPLSAELSKAEETLEARIENIKGSQKEDRIKKSLKQLFDNSQKKNALLTQSGAFLLYLEVKNYQQSSDQKIEWQNVKEVTIQVMDNALSNLPSEDPQSKHAADSIRRYQKNLAEPVEQKQR